MKKFLAIIRRILFEFGPPALVGFAWMLWDVGFWKASLLDHVKSFGIAFFMAAWFWSQLLRIIYQHTQRERMEGLGEQLGLLTGTIERMGDALRVILDRATGEIRDDLRGLITMAGTADRQIRSVTSDFQSLWERSPWYDETKPPLRTGREYD